MKNSIYVNNIEVYAYHGVLIEEQTLGQKFIFDVECILDFKKAMISDNLLDSVSYANISDLIVKVATNNKYNLLERLSFEVMKEIFINYEQVIFIKLKINKPSAPISYTFSECGVVVEASREEIFSF